MIASATNEGIISMRVAQREVFWSDAGQELWLWRRQFGKSRTLGAWGIRQMIEMRGCAVFFVSASIVLGTENIRKEAEIWIETTNAMRKFAANAGMKLTTDADLKGGKMLDADAVADLFEHSKLETKIWHDSTTYSRSRVVAPNPSTAVGWTGHVVLDEVGRIPDLKDIMEAVEPFMSSNPQFRYRLATTPPPADDHYSWEIIVPPQEEFPVRPEGNWYESQAGIRVHRLDVYDAYAAGIPMYHPKTREKISPEESRRLAFDKTAWDRNYALRFIRGGVAACSLSHLFLAMERGQDLGIAEQISEEVVAA